MKQTEETTRTLSRLLSGWNEAVVAVVKRMVAARRKLEKEMEEKGERPSV